MYRFTFFSKKSLPLLRPLTKVKVITGSNASSLRNSFPLISGAYRQISLNSSDSEASSSNNVGDSNTGEQDPHSKIMEILRESVVMNDRTHTIESQVRYGKTFRYGELYAPHDLNENNYKNRKSMSRWEPPTVDTFNALRLNPLIEYKNFTLLSNFVSDMGRILPRSVTGSTAKNQRKLAKAIKRARSFGLIPSTHRRKVNFYDTEFMAFRMKKSRNKEALDFES
ncbi:unnamed protein product [Rhizophagus irregularis]|uniref:Small ribosomal subunit protein bS18m n=4 Tax=Rhizophagus irregularis TaxID=588596 RepID=A0A915ZPJ4_9GLOM|nr:hypothetical protein RirG_227860 [Rhizophagus irregularis DAOM 197198w]UZO12582.1 hypothetical protein OCT59_004114 [Rhizophagus irregularis]GBC53582.1 ribosomal protein S18 [Rhizophagus irregularis DAOM 181602=DAOM 197198]CAB4406326.1 unnamed protein product [Rhizophagus irregularis]CAB4407531.1 unnamed protein product [Rhizophagus irregularis]